RAVGIEHEGFVDDPRWFSWEMYTASATLARWLSDRYQIPRDREHILGHAELPGQSHQDPGPGWDWALYMALIEDVVPARRLQGRVIDGEADCELIPLRDTWLTRTPMDAIGIEVNVDAACALPAGEPFPVLATDPGFIGHLRVHFDPHLGPCADLSVLDGEGYVAAETVELRCSEGSAGVAWVTVVLDEGPRVVTDASGAFSFVEVEPGLHSLDVLGGLGFTDGLEIVESDDFPGTRVLIPLARRDGLAAGLSRGLQP
ncbi:MAG: N-acetylmuramoyl-L-alanine amidase, partial [Myxococcales bacterium]|nr:N-acetylmuramoyl-L-alanine amidase [Myxococcales bacterium]